MCKICCLMLRSPNGLHMASLQFLIAFTFVLEPFSPCDWFWLSVSLDELQSLDFLVYQEDADQPFDRVDEAAEGLSRDASALSF